MCNFFQPSEQKKDAQVTPIMVLNPVRLADLWIINYVVLGVR